MPTDDTRRRDTPVPVKSGSAGPPKRPEPDGADVEPPSPEQLDARQERINPTRRRGPELKEGDTDALADVAPPDIEPTECDEEGEEEPQA
jgi:hypothetical protein